LFSQVDRDDPANAQPLDGLLTSLKVGPQRTRNRRKEDIIHRAEARLTNLTSSSRSGSDQTACFSTPAGL
jgi:hypothetical protein